MKRSYYHIGQMHSLHYISPIARAKLKHNISFTKPIGKTTSVKKMQKKLRAHFHYIVKQKKQAEDYGVHRIKAVLVESIDDHWTNTIRTAAWHPIVSGSKPSPLFWFTPSDIAFEKLITVKIKGAEKQIPIFLEKPELVFQKIWATPIANEENPDFKSLIDD